MRRRQILLGAGLAAGTGLGIAAPAIAKGKRRLTMVTDWPDGPGMMHSARRLAESITEISEGRLSIEIFSSGALVRPFETFDAVRSGLADLFHTHVGYFGQEAQTFQFFSGLPFGLTPDELFAWIHFGGGQALWDELGERFDIKPLLCCNTGTQMGGWFKEELRSVQELEGLRYRMAGLGADVFRQLGAVVVLLPAADIVQALRSGAIDACEWVGPWLDTHMGLHRAANYYYYPGWHEPSGAITLGIKLALWNALDRTDQQLIALAAAAEHARSLAEFDSNNARALKQLRQSTDIELRRFSEPMLHRMAEISADLVADIGSSDALARKIYASYSAFRSAAGNLGDVGTGAYMDARTRAMTPQ